MGVGVSSISWNLPEKELLACVLELAVLDAICAELPVTADQRMELARRRKRAVLWFFSDSLHCSPGRGISFMYICEALGLDSRQIRKWVLVRCAAVMR